MNDPTRTNKYFVPGWAFESDGSARPERGLVDEPSCPPQVIHVDISVSVQPPVR